MMQLITLAYTIFVETLPRFKMYYIIILLYYYYYFQ